MPRVKAENRKRARRPKTRNGCRTCKIRRVKCDEAKPFCQRCAATGRCCDGYDSPSSDEGALTPPSSSVSSIFGSKKEHRSFAFFLERTSHQLSGFYECDFWNRVVLQAAHDDPGIRYAVVALGSLHEDFEKTGEAERSPDDFALQQYNLAIRQHLNSLDGSEKDTGKIDSYVASCVIFMCIELLQGHYLSAISLLKGAVKLFYERNADSRGSSSWPVEIFENILSRMQAQAIGLLSASAVGPTVPPRLKASLNAWIPTKFRSVAQAKDYLEFYTNSHTLAKAPPLFTVNPDAKNFRMYSDVLTHWSSAFDGLLESSEVDMSEQDQRAANILKIWRLMIRTGVGIHIEHPSQFDDQTLWDFYEHNSAEVVRLAEIIMEQTVPFKSSHDAPPHLFTLDFGIVGALYDTARICRDPIIRRKAIHLLRAYPCRQGLWDSLLAARCAERQMELEEDAVLGVTAAADVPGWARISCAMPTFQIGQRYASILYTRQRPSDGSEPATFKEVIEW